MSVSSGMPNVFRSVMTFACALLATSAFAQSTPWLDAVREHVSIRQSLRDKNTINEPAFVTLTWPDGGENINVVAVAVSALLRAESSNPRFNLGGAVQFNQNSASNSRQNVFVGGVELEGRAGSDAAEQPFFFPRFRGTAGYKRNGEKHTAGFASAGYVTVEKNRPDADSSSIPIGTKVEFTPQAGLEYDNVLSATTSDSEGSVTRGLVAVKVNAFLLPKKFKDRLALSADFAYRRDLRTDFETDDKDYPFAQFSLAVALDPYKILSVSIDRVMGEDPTQDLNGPDFTRISFKVQLTKPQKRAIVRTRAAGHII